MGGKLIGNQMGNIVQNETLTTCTTFYMKINSRKLQLTIEKSYACYSYLQIAINYQ